MNTTSSATPPSDIRRPLLAGMALLVVGVGGLLTWAWLAPLDEGIPLAGTVVVEGKRKTVQHLTGGIVTGILVREGEQVRAGQPLLQLDTTQLQGQRQILLSQLGALEAEAYGLQGAIPLRQQEVASLQTEVAELAPLVSEALYPRARYDEQLRQLAQLQRQLLADRTGLQRVRAQIREQQDRLAVLAEDMTRASVLAPIAGTVLDLSVHTIGAVLPPGARALDLVPQDSALIIEAHIPPHLIERARTGQATDIRFTALDPRRTPVIEGRLVSLGADTVSDKDGQAVYVARVSPDPEQLSGLGKNVHLHPGMPVEVTIITGERSLLTYLLKPLSDSFASGLKER